MKDIETMLKVMSDAARESRSHYHVTLGNLIAELEKVPPEAPVTFDIGLSPTNPHSYRGYYSDLAFEGTGDVVTAGDLLAAAKAALGATFEGYKGGDFVMSEKTPLWAASYGNCGRAIVSLAGTAGAIVLVTKDVD